MNPLLRYHINEINDLIVSRFSKPGDEGVFKEEPARARFAKAGSPSDCGHDSHGFKRFNKCAVSKSGKAIDKSEKTHPVRGEMVEASLEGTGKGAKIVMSDGSAVPSHIKTSMVPPAWTDVKVSVDPNAEVLVTARDKKGRPQMVTSKSYKARSAAVKFSRIQDMLDEYDNISREIQEARHDPKTKEDADCAWLMQVQATRPGSNADTKAKVKAYGATTLEGRHVVVSGNEVRLKFIGKEGVSHNHMIRDKELAKMLVDRKNSVGPHNRIFKTSYAKVRDFTANRDGGKFTPKDFRTSRATILAMELVKANPSRARNAKTYKARVKEVAMRVSKLLGNKPAEALKSYINPAVFSVWSPKNEIQAT